MAAGKDSTVRPAQRLVTGQAIAFLAMALLIACIYRLIWLNKFRSEGLREQASRQQHTRTTYPARRGAIVDANPTRPEQHVTLAASYLLDSVTIDPQEVSRDDGADLVAALGTALNLGASKQADLLRRVVEAQRPAIWRWWHARTSPHLAKRLLASVNRDARPGPAAGAPAEDEVEIDSAGGGPSLGVLVRSISVKHLISEEESARIHELCNDKRFRGLVLEPELKRDYPAGQLAAHVIGFLGNDGRPLEGLEKRFDEKLAGIDGSKEAISDVRHNSIWSSEHDYVPPQDGLTLVLNINSVIQSAAEQVLTETVGHYQAESGVAVVMDPTSGAVLAMANVPTYSPGKFGQATQDSRRNRALTDPFEPGSIFKWAVMAGALEDRFVKPTDTFDCHGGSWNYQGRRTIKDAHGYGTLTVREILVKSSNIGMAQIGLKMGKQPLYDWLSRFGFGHKTGIELSNVEDAGSLAATSRWTGDSTPSISFGQEVMVTPIQMLAGFAVLANGVLDSQSLFGDAVLSDEVKATCLRNGRLVNGGYLIQPRLVQAMVDDSDVTVGGSARVVEDYSKPVVRRRVVSEATARAMMDFLTEVVEKGTGQKAKIDGIKVFGKTGTAQIAEGRHYTDQYVASFIGGAPAERPRLVVIVSIRKPKKDIGYFGGTVAAPAVKQILEKSLAFLGAKQP